MEYIPNPARLFRSALLLGTSEYFRNHLNINHGILKLRNTQPALITIKGDPMEVLMYLLVLNIQHFEFFHQMTESQAFVLVFSLQNTGLVDSQ